MQILVLRFSSMGDVAMTVPVLKGLIEQNPGICITLVTRELYEPFFEEIPRLRLFLCDFDNDYKGFSGIFRLFKRLNKSAKYDHIVDLHSVLRSWILGLFFRLTGMPVSVINKGRKEKKKLVKGSGFKKLEPTTDRYLDAFRSLDLSFIYPEKPVITVKESYQEEASAFIRKTDPQNPFRIGIAPFALHKLKTWPREHTEKLLSLIEKKTAATVYLFGGGEREVPVLAAVAGNFKNCYTMAGQLSLGAELSLMQKMRFMITMDSANMHLSALSGTPTIALWGATHPYAGFEAYQQKEERNIQVPRNELTCRPCTIFGKGDCYRGDFACMQWLTPELIFEKINKLGLLTPAD